jgi:hypothetical protein
LVDAINLPSPNQEYTQGDVFTVSGWGTTKEDAEDAETLLRKVDVPYVTDTSKDLFKRSEEFLFNFFFENLK